MKNFCLVELLRNFNFARASVENAVLQASGWQNGRPLVKLMEFRKRSGMSFADSLFSDFVSM